MKQSNSFKSEKCLLYRDNLDGIISGDLRPPIEVNIDPINDCDLKCVWCNAKRVLNKKFITTASMIRLLSELADWGVKGICFAGGGEPTLHPDLDEFIKYCTELGLESAIITNGHAWTDKLIETIVDHMRWVGISVDAATPETFLKLKKVDGFTRTLKNIYKLIYYKEMDKTKNIGVTFKFLIHPDNQHEILKAAEIAKDLRVDSFHLRPVDFMAYRDSEQRLDLDLINKQVEEGVKLNDDNFEFIPFFACFDDKLNTLRLDKCLLSPLLGICLPDGWWLCIDRKGRKELKLCGLHEIREFWGSKNHQEIIESTNPRVKCGKCTLSKYYDWYNMYKDDLFYWKFV